MKLELKDIIVVCVIIIIALVAGLLSAYQYIDSVKKDNKNEQTTEQLIQAQEQLILTNNKISSTQERALNLSEELKKSQQESSKKSDELISAQSKINVLQSEIIDQVIGKGYPIFKIMNSLGDNFEVYLQCSTDYPIYKVFFRILDSEKLLKCDTRIQPNKVDISASCYNASIIFDPHQSRDLNGKNMHFIGYTLPKKNYFLMIEFLCRNIKTVQYSIIKFDGKNLLHDYRIYDVSSENSDLGVLLENSNPKISNDIYSNHFFEGKTLMVHYSK